MSPSPGTSPSSSRRRRSRPGDHPNNIVEAFGAPAGEPDQSLGTAELRREPPGPGDITTAGKRATLASLGPGQSDTYTVSGSNPNAGPLDDFMIHDILPITLVATQDGQPNVTGTGTAPQVSYGPNASAFDPGHRDERRRHLARHRAGIGGGDRRQLRHRACRVLGQLPDPRRHPGQRPRPGGNPIPAELPDPQLRHRHRHLGRHAGHAAVVVHRPDRGPAVRACSRRCSPRQPVVAPGGTVSWSSASASTPAPRVSSSTRSSPTACRRRSTWSTRPTRPTRSTGARPRTSPRRPRSPARRTAAGPTRCCSPGPGRTSPCRRAVTGTFTINTTVGLDAAPATVTNTATSRRRQPVGRLDPRRPPSTSRRRRC